MEQVGEKTIDWTEQVWEHLVNFALTKGPEILAALIIAAIGYVICRWIRRVIFNILTQSSVESSAVTFITELAYFFCLAIVAVMALGTLGFSTTSISAALGGIGLGIGLALKDKVSNVASGIYILMFQPFRVGDYIDAGGGTSGNVENIRIMYTELRTTGNQLIIVPNLTMTSSVITNYSRLDTRNVEMNIGVGVRHGPAGVRRAHPGDPLRVALRGESGDHARLRESPGGFEHHCLRPGGGAPGRLFHRHERALHRREAGARPGGHRHPLPAARGAPCGQIKR